jgi:hypothetical protein
MHTNNIGSIVVQERSKKFRHLKMSVFREIYYTVALTFTLTQSHCSAQGDEKDRH